LEETFLFDENEPSASEASCFRTQAQKVDACAYRSSGLILSIPDESEFSGLSSFVKQSSHSLAQKIDYLEFEVLVFGVFDDNLGLRIEGIGKDGERESSGLGTGLYWFGSANQLQLNLI